MGDKRKAVHEIWTTEPAEDDYPAAQAYLSLLMGFDAARRVVDALRVAETTHRKAKDLLRASRLALLSKDDVEVASDLKKIKRGEPLSPVLLLRGDWGAHGRPLEIADGYHRICAGLEAAENAEIPCRIAAFPQL